MATTKYPLHVTNSRKYIEYKLAELYARRDTLILKIRKLQTKKQIIMAYVCVSKSGQEYICSIYPERNTVYNIWQSFMDCGDEYEEDYVDIITELPKGSIEKLTGRKLTWEDEPVAIY